MVASAAYRHSARMSVAETGTVADYSRKADTVHSEVALPPDALRWIRQMAGIGEPESDRHVEGANAIAFSEKLWNFVEAFETRANARFARELTIALPGELSREENIALVRNFVAEHVTAKGFVADWAFHWPEGAEHNPHVHLLTTERPLTVDGFGSKGRALLDDDGNAVRTRKGVLVMERFAGSEAELRDWRAGWARAANQALALAGHEVTIDHRSYADRGLDWLEPTKHHGPGRHVGGRGFESGTVERHSELAERQMARFEANPSLVLMTITEQKATFDDRDIQRTILRYADTRERAKNLRLRVGALPELMDIQAELYDPQSNQIVQRPRYTTAAMLELEAGLFNRASARHADCSFGVRSRRREAAIDRAEAVQGFAYSPEQRAAVTHLTGLNGMAAMVGYAGAGKSTVMRAVAEVYRDAGHDVVGAALSGKAAEELQKSAGINARTLASWQGRWAGDGVPLERGDVFVLDEAGMVPSREMAELVERLDQCGAKLIVIGDDRQLQPIGAGAAFRAIADIAGVYELTQVRRQRTPWQAEASIAFGLGRTNEALAAYHDHGHIGFHDKLADAHTDIVTGWLADWRAGADARMFAHRRADVRALNTKARAVIKEAGGLAAETPFMTADAIRQFACGDQVIFLKNEHSLGVKNGTLGTVTEAGDGRLAVDVPHLAAPVFVDQNIYNNIDHAYAMTIHKTQGSTVDRAHVLATGSMDAQLSYVGLSRHREDVRLHVARDTFSWRKDAGPVSDAAVFKRMARDNAKDTTLQYRGTEDYGLSFRAIAAERAEPALARFIDLRGLPRPAEIRARVDRRIEELKAWAWT